VYWREDSILPLDSETQNTNTLWRCTYFSGKSLKKNEYSSMKYEAPLNAPFKFKSRPFHSVLNTYL
jgi:hypothetical protein